MRVSIVQNTETGLTHLKGGVVSTGGSTVSVAEPFCPTTSRNWEEATSLIGVKQHQKVVLVWREGVGCIAAQVPKVVSGEERGI